MTPTNEEYTVAAFCEAVKNDLQNRITWCAIEHASNGARINGQKFDNNISAAIQAGEWLDRAVESYRG